MLDEIKGVFWTLNLDDLLATVLLLLVHLHFLMKSETLVSLITFIAFLIVYILYSDLFLILFFRLGYISQLFSFSYFVKRGNVSGFYRLVDRSVFLMRIFTVHKSIWSLFFARRLWCHVLLRLALDSVSHFAQSLYIDLNLVSAGVWAIT